MYCPVTRKRSFLTETIAEDALIQHHEVQFHEDGAGPINIYECDHCGDWHFTSKGSVHPRLIKERAHIERNRLGTFWERRLR